MIYAFAFALILWIAAITTAPFDGQKANFFSELEGVWKITKMEIDGKSLPVNWKIIIRDGKATSDSKNALQETVDLSKFLDPSKTPKTITFPHEEGITFYGIYDVNSDELRICGDGVETATEKNPETRRPKKFDSKEGLLLIFNREKK